MRTEKYLQDALEELLNKKSIEKIRVNEIIETVGACKGTFYRYYQDKYQLLTSYFTANLYDDAVKNCSDVKDFLNVCLKYFQERPKVIINSFSSQDVSGVRAYHERIFIDFLLNEVEFSGNEEDDGFLVNIIKLYASNCTDIILYWLQKLPQRPVSAVLSFMDQIKPLVLIKAYKVNKTSIQHTKSVNKTVIDL